MDDDNPLEPCHRSAGSKMIAMDRWIQLQRESGRIQAQTDDLWVFSPIQLFPGWRLAPVARSTRQSQKEFRPDDHTESLLVTLHHCFLLVGNITRQVMSWSKPYPDGNQNEACSKIFSLVLLTTMFCLFEVRDEYVPEHGDAVPQPQEGFFCFGGTSEHICTTPT